jgi:hypothetical protein
MAKQAKQAKKHKAADVQAQLRAHLEEHGPHKGTAPSLAKAIGVPVEVMGRAAQATRKPGFYEEHGWMIPPTGRGKDTVWKLKTKRTRSARKQGDAAEQATAADAHTGSLAA